MLYVGTGNITLKVLTHRDLTTADTYGLKYEKPDGTQGQVDTDDGMELHENGKAIIWAIDDDTFLDQAGRWRFQAFAIFDGTTAHGNVVDIKVHENLSS